MTFRATKITKSYELDATMQTVVMGYFNGEITIAEVSRLLGANRQSAVNLIANIMPQLVRNGTIKIGEWKNDKN